MKKTPKILKPIKYNNIRIRDWQDLFKNIFVIYNNRLREDSKDVPYIFSPA